jgi:hypothetical protein
VRPILGDLNGDGRITVSDVTKALRLSIGLETATDIDLLRGDVGPMPGSGPNAGKPLGDGAINVTDALLLLRHVAGLPGGPWTDPKNPVSFARIHKEIFLQSCATSSCHNSNARRAGLDLENPLEAFALLVGHDAANDAAIREGKKRVAAGQPDASFLMTKLTGPTEDEGVKMPYGTDGLPADQIERIRQWIMAGARFDTDDGTLTGDSGTPTVDPKAVDVTLPPPPPNQGFQMSFGPFDVPQGQEIQRDFFAKTPNADERWIKRVEYAYNKGSHHLLIFKSDATDVPDHVETKFGIFLTPDWQLVTAAQNEAVTSEFPKGVGMRLSAHQQMDFQMHYVNLGSQVTPTGRGKLVVNFWYAEPGETTARAGFLFGTKIGFTLPPHQETTLFRNFVFDQDVKVFAMVGHFHSRGRQFRIYRWDPATQERGDLVYESKEWDDPRYATFDPPLLVKADMGLTFEAVYQNDTNRLISEGPYAATEEHLFYWAWFYRDNEMEGKNYLDAGF